MYFWTVIEKHRALMITLLTVLNRVHASVRDLDNLIQRDEASLQGSEIHQQIHSLRVVLLQARHLLPTSRKACQFVTWRETQLWLEDIKKNYLKQRFASGTVKCYVRHLKSC